MICRNCGYDAKNDNYCPHCGAPMQSTVCPSCGTVLPPDASQCYSCGWSKFPARYGNVPQGNYPSQNYGNGPQGYPPQGYGGAPQGYYNNQPMPEVNSNAKGLLPRKKKNDTAPQPSDKRTLFQTLICFIGGLAVLAAIGVSTYLILMGNMFAENVGGTVIAMDPLTMTPIAEGQTFGLVTNFSSIIDYFKSVPELFGSIQGEAELVKLVSQTLIIVAMCAAAAVIALVTLLAVIKFIIGMVSKKNFNLGAFAGVAFGTSAMLYALTYIGAFNTILDVSSGTVICLFLSAVALAVCLVQNLLFAGKRFIKAGSIAKWLTNAGILAGAIVSLLNFPLAFTNTFDGSTAGMNSEALDSVIGVVVSALTEGAAPAINVSLICLAIILVLTLKNAATLPYFVGITASRFVRTFKFDGYEDKGFVRKGFVFAVWNVLLAVAVFVYVFKSGIEGMNVASGLYVYLVGTAVVLASAILNRMFLNKDQL